MDMGVYPRVNSKFLPQFIGKRVTLFGEVLNCSGDSCFVKASDGGEVKVFLPPGETLESKFVQISGKVEAQGAMISVQALNAIAAGNSFNMENYDQLVEMWNGKFSHIFQ